MASADVHIYQLKPVFHDEQPGVFLLHVHLHTAVCQENI